MNLRPSLHRLSAILTSAAALGTFAWFEPVEASPRGIYNGTADKLKFIDSGGVQNWPDTAISISVPRKTRGRLRGVFRGTGSGATVRDVPFRGRPRRLVARQGFTKFHLVGTWKWRFSFVGTNGDAIGTFNLRVRPNNQGSRTIRGRINVRYRNKTNKPQESFRFLGSISATSG